jgi:type II secretory pathway component GspD/PulD (secretin)
MRTLLVAWWILVVAGAPREAQAEQRDDGANRDDRRALCGRDARHRGTAIDLDVKDADIHDVFRLIADAARVNLVIPDDVTGKVTLRLLRVPWDAVACAVAAVHHLAITIDGNILLVMRARAP